MPDPIDVALSIGELEHARTCAVAAAKAAKKKGAGPYLGALRRVATITALGGDDEDLPSLAATAKAWRAVCAEPSATARDHEDHAWAELLAGAPKKAADALAASAGRSARHDLSVATLALAWTKKRSDAKKRQALVDAALAEADLDRLVGTTRLLVQSHSDARALADTLAERARRDAAPYDPIVARAVAIRVGAYRVVDDTARASEIRDAWAAACRAALPDPNDPRLHVLDVHESGDDLVARAERRVARASRVYAADDPALEMPLSALAYAARTADDHRVVVEAVERLLRLSTPKRASRDEERYHHLGNLRESLTALGRYDEALAVVDREDTAAKGNPLRLVPNHHARASVHEARGDWDRVILAHLAAVAQYEAGPAPVYGPGSQNLDLARNWARLAYERAGRGEEGNAKFPNRFKRKAT